MKPIYPSDLKIWEFNVQIFRFEEYDQSKSRRAIMGSSSTNNTQNRNTQARNTGAPAQAQPTRAQATAQARPTPNARTAATPTARATTPTARAAKPSNRAATPARSRSMAESE